MERELIGYAVFDEDYVYHKADYECAAWYENVLIKAGKYPIYRTSSPRHSEDYDGYIHYSGEIVSDYFGTLFCGSPIGTYDARKNAGKQTSFSSFIYDFMLARCILDNGGYVYGNTNERFELLPGYEAFYEEYEWDGEKKKHPSIRKTN